MLALLISDVPGDNPGDIASGPTVGHSGDAARALAALRHWGVTPPPSIQAFLEAGGDPVRPDDPRLDRVENVIVAAPSQSLQAAAAWRRRRATTSTCWATPSRARRGTSRARMPLAAGGEGAAA
jgi:glycerate-2-kinase